MQVPSLLLPRTKRHGTSKSIGTSLFFAQSLALWRTHHGTQKGLCRNSGTILWANQTQRTLAISAQQRHSGQGGTRKISAQQRLSALKPLVGRRSEEHTSELQSRQ